MIVLRLGQVSHTLTGEQSFRLGLPHFYAGLVVLVFAAGSFFGEKMSQKRNYEFSGNVDSKGLVPFMLVIAGLTILAYLIWFLPILSNLNLMIDIVFGRPGAMYVVRNSYTTIPGITTLTQLGIVYVSVYTVFRQDVSSYSRLLDMLFYVIVMLTLVRVIVWSERLAFIEIAVAIGVATQFGPRRIRLPRLISFLLPLLAIFLLIIFFVVFEYRRTWINYYVNYYDSIFVFGTDRFLEYYVLAINNGAGLMYTYKWPSWDPAASFSFIFEFPFVGSYIRSAFGETKNHAMLFLHYTGNEEFNNISGVFTLLFELGPIAFLLTYLCGWLVGRSFSLALTARFGVVVYSCVYVGMLEMLRIAYYSTGRFFVVMLGLFLFILVLNSSTPKLKIFDRVARV
jgi:hypothetical protein